ncbi:cation/H+ exchanger [Ganoderma leucocontextum]|nr:cation/H+ exchanger [Ganoderma leucocontextum]
MGAFSDEILWLARRAAAPEQAGIFAGDNPANWNASDPFRLWVIQVIVIIGMTQLLALLLGRIRQPRVIAEVIGGVILGPSVMGHIPGFTQTIFPTASMPVLNLTANLGLVLFMFIVGMEIDTRVLRRNARASSAISVVGLILPLGLGAAIAVPIYHEFTDGSANIGYFILFVAVAVGITAFPVLCRILTELKLLDTTVGVVTLSAGVGNDVVGWVLLALVVALINASSGLTALWVLLAGLGFVIFILLPGRWAYYWLAKKSGCLDAGSPSAMMMTVTILTVLVSAFYTDVIGIHAIFGAFLSGLIIPHENGYEISLVEKLEDLLSILLLPLYFALSGLRTNLGLLNNGVTWGYTILICVVSFFTKFLGCGVTAKLMGFNMRESGAIGTLMSCKGLVELIVLNVGLTAGILDTRTFSMFVLHALVLTFITTPLTLLFYPPKYRVHTGELPKQPAPAPEDGTGSTEREIQDALKSRFAVVVDRIEQLPAVMTLTQLLQAPSAIVAPPSDVSSVDEKAPLAEVDALRLIELTNRTSAVLKSQAADSLALSDPVLAIFKTFGYLHRMVVTTALAVVGYEDFSENVNRHVRSSSSQMVILPWTSGLGAVDDIAEDPASHAASPSSNTTASPFDALFQTKREKGQGHSPVATHSHFIRRVFADAPADVALFWDRGIPQGRESEGEGQYHVLMPFFGGPDDRSALAFVVQLCMHPSVTATVVRMTKIDGAELEPTDTIEQIKGHNTVHSTVFPDTVYGAQTTQTRMASETADDLLWTKLTTAAAPELANAFACLTFREETSAQPLHHVLDVAARAASSQAQARQIVVAGRSRRMAVESHQVELQKLVGERGATLGAELPKTLGHVACAFVVGGSAQASLLVIQATQKW